MSSAPSAPTNGTSIRIFNAAVELFYDRGFRGTTIRNIVERCGLTPGSLYLYYRSKDALLESIVAETNVRLGQQLAAARASAGPTASEQLAALTAAFAEFVGSNREVSLVSDIEWRHLTGVELMKVRAIRRAIGQEFLKLIKLGVDSGEFTLPTGADGAAGARQVSNAILMQILGIARQQAEVELADAPKIFADLALRQVGYSKSMRSASKSAP